MEETIKLVLFSKNLEIYKEFIESCKVAFSDILFVSDSDKNIFQLNGVIHSPKSSENFHNFVENITKFNGDMLISFNYNSFIQEEILNSFDFAYNFHGSLLPNYSGPHSINWQIINGEEKTGVTIHELTPEIDGGNIVMQKEFKIFNEDTAQDVLKKNVELSSKMLENLVKGFIQNNLPSRKQIKNGNEYICKLRKPEDGQILKGMSINTIYNMARALAEPWPGIFYFDEKGIRYTVNQKISISESEEIFKKINC